MKKNKFKPGIKISIFFLIFASLFFFLGIWQIERGKEKNDLLNLFENSQKKPAKIFTEASIKWDRVFVYGQFDNTRSIYIDNVVNKGIAGYKVLTPLEIDNVDKLLLVDRGWVERGISRDILPEIKPYTKKIKITGVLESPELGLLLSEEVVSENWPKVSQSKNIDILKKEYDQDIYPFVLLADPIMDNALEYIGISPTNMMPAKHYGYAAQWFTMFVVLCLMFAWIGFKKNEK